MKPPAQDTAPVIAPALETGDGDLRSLDRLREAHLARWTKGLSPESLTLAWTDWALHMAGAPGKRTELALHASQALAGFWAAAMQTSEPDTTVSADPRFASPAWRAWPFASWTSAFLETQAWWQAATHGVPGMQPHHEDILSFVARQALDVFSPSNSPWTNPEVLQRTVDEAGANLWRGAQQALQDIADKLGGLPPEGASALVVGTDLAATPGRVVLRNHLVELLQYDPITPTVQAEPVLLVPAWIMKYYILDLSAHNSLVRWLVSKGHTVFCLSWRNVDSNDRELSMDDYRRLGPMAALDAIGHIVPGRRVHAVGYCLGGTLMAMTAAAMARAGDDRLATLTLFAAQTDFSEPGELQLFIDPGQVHMLDSMMWQRGFLTAEQMTGAFQMLRSNDLVWSRMVHEYLLGERAPMIDLMVWNADSTRMPYRMHSEYLHRFFLGNDLAAGRCMVDGHPVALQNIRVPIFALGTERDHVAPWRSVYKIHYLADTEVTFALTNGGHNAGVVSEPGHAHRHYRLLTRAATETCLSAEEWQATAASHEGSWWPAWQRWLVQHSTRGRVRPPTPPASLGEAPGEYVLQR